MSFGENIKTLRKIYQLSQEDIAKIAGVTNKAVSTWENDIKMPRMGTVQKIADHFNLQKSNLIEESGLLALKLSDLDHNVQVRDSKDNIVVIDDETRDIIDKLRTRPEMKVLFSVSKKASKEDILKAVKIIEALRDDE